MDYYYHPNPTSDFTLSAEESAHVVKVMRKHPGDNILIMDGNGFTYRCTIEDANHRKCKFSIQSKNQQDGPNQNVHIAIAPTKNIDRLEWFVEKACELGISEITPIHTKRTERNRVNLDRLEKKAINAMKQSKNYWKCSINPVIELKNFLIAKNSGSQRFIASVATGGNEQHLKKLFKPNIPAQILIGPEGDFSEEEVDQANRQGFISVNLGKSVLRTETAGIIASHIAVLANESGAYY